MARENSVNSPVFIKFFLKRKDNDHFIYIFPELFYSARAAGPDLGAYVVVDRDISSAGFFGQMDVKAVVINQYDFIGPVGRPECFNPVEKFSQPEVLLKGRPKAESAQVN